MKRAFARPLALAAALLAFAAAPLAAAAPDQRAILADWALARCVARAAPGTPLAADATRSAAALLERSDARAEVFARIDRAGIRFDRRVYGGSTGGTYAMLRCLDFARSHELATVIGAKR